MQKHDEDIFDIALAVYKSKNLARYDYLADLSKPLPFNLEELLELAAAETRARLEAGKRYKIKKEPFELFNATAYFLQVALLPSSNRFRNLGLREAASIEQIQKHYDLICEAFFNTEFDITSHWNPEHIQRFNDSYMTLLQQAQAQAEKLKTKHAQVPDTVLVNVRPPVPESAVLDVRDPVPDTVLVNVKPPVADTVLVNVKPPVEASLIDDVEPSIPESVIVDAEPSIPESVTVDAEPSIPEPVIVDDKPPAAETMIVTPEPPILETMIIDKGASVDAGQDDGIDIEAGTVATDSDAAMTVVRTPLPKWALRSRTELTSVSLYPVLEKLKVGRHSQSDIVLPISEISRHHAEVSIKNDQLFVRDLGSVNGTFINGEKIESGWLKAGDLICFDVLEFEVLSLDKKATMPVPAPARPSSQEPLQLKGISGPVDGKQYQLDKDRLTIGRAKKNDIIIKDSTISSVHAELVRSEEGWHVRDLDSLNGVYINGKKEADGILRARDKVRFGRVVLELL